MAKIRYTVRLYRLHDLDLITFLETHEFSVIRGIYSSLSAFAKGELFVIEIPPRREKKLPALNRVYIKALTLDTEKDKEAVEVLSQIAPGYRNSFMKHLLRLYLCNPLSEEFFRTVKHEKGTDNVIFETPQAEVDEKNEHFMEMFKIFRDGKKVVPAGKIRNNGRHKPVTESDENISGSETEIQDMIEHDADEDIIEDMHEDKEPSNSDVEIPAIESIDLKSLEIEIPDILTDDDIEIEQPSAEREVTPEESSDITDVFSNLI